MIKSHESMKILNIIFGFVHTFFLCPFSVFVSNLCIEWMICLEMSHVWTPIYFCVSINSNHDDFVQTKLKFEERKKWKKCSSMNCPCFFFQIMRRREIQSFSLKLSDLKEYEKAREERAELNKSAKSSSESPSSPIKLVKYGPKSKQEVRDRIGMKS